MDDRVKNNVREYLDHLEDLYKQVQQWLSEAGFTWEEQNTSINEELTGRYDAPQLIIHHPDSRQVAELRPVGVHIVGAKGRVDLKGPLDSTPILYLLKGGPAFRTTLSTESGEKLEEHVRPLYKGVDHEGWYTLENRRPKSVHPLERKTFLDLLEQVADYEPQQST